MLEQITVARVVATPTSLDRLVPPAAAIVLRIAPDEALLVDAHPDDVALDDPHALVTRDTGWLGVWLDSGEAERMLEAGADWQPSPDRPILEQGMLVQLPVKLWFEADRALLLAPYVVAADLNARIGGLT